MRIDDRVAHTLTQLAPHTHWLSPYGATDRPALGVIQGTRHSLVIDAGASPAHARALKTHLAARGLRLPSLAMLTHWHWDHVFGTAEWDVPTCASRETARIVRHMAGQDWSDAALDARVAGGSEIAFCRDMLRLELPERADLVIRPPEIAFDSALTLDLGGVTCQLIHVGGDHAHDSTIVFVEQDRVAFLGDCAYADLYHGPRRLTAQLFALQDRLLALDADTYVLSHHDAPMSRAEFIADAAQYRRVGALAIAHPEAGIAALGDAPTENDVEDMHAFLAGLALPIVKSIW